MTVIRRRSHFIGSWIGIVVLLLVVGVGIVLAPPPNASLGDTLGIAALFCVIIWFIAMIGRTKIVLDQERMLVVNTFQRWEIPWSIVDTVQSGREVYIRLVDGRTITPAISGGSLLEDLRKNALQRRIRERIEQARPTGVARNLEFVLEPKLALAPVKFAIFLVVMEGLALLGYYTNR